MIRGKEGRNYNGYNYSSRSFQTSQAQPFKLFPRSRGNYYRAFFASPGSLHLPRRRYPTDDRHGPSGNLLFPSWFAFLLFCSVLPATLPLSWKFNRVAATSPLMRFFAARSFFYLASFYPSFISCRRHPPTRDFLKEPSASVAVNNGNLLQRTLAFKISWRRKKSTPVFRNYGIDRLISTSAIEKPE